MTIDHYLILATIQTILSGLVAFMCLVRFKSRSTVIRLMGFIFLASSVANCVAYGLVETNVFRKYINMPNVIYMVFSFILFARVYFLLLKKNSWLFVAVTIAFISFALVNVLFVQKLTLNSYTSIAYSATIIIYALLYFYFLMRELPTQYVHKLPMFWFNSGLLFFHAGVFFLFSFTPYLVYVLKNDMIVYYSFHNLLSIIQHLLMIVGAYYDLASLNWRTLGTKKTTL